MRDIYIERSYENPKIPVLWDFTCRILKKEAEMMLNSFQKTVKLLCFPSTDCPHLFNM